MTKNNPRPESSRLIRQAIGDKLTAKDARCPDAEILYCNVQGG